ncbi:MAG: hypothetical protein HY736_04985 [Verrucomicrobia bacterium]|nr:hypothetical protein [Verrucomicrobiota bacterium]
MLATLAALVARAQSPAPATTPNPAPPTATVTAPALNWVLPLFTDREGYRSMTLRGSAVQPSGANAISVTDLSITVFSGDATARVDTVLLSLDATFFPKENRAAGEKTVRVIRDEIEITGENWTYDHAGKIVSIRKNVRVVYRLPLKLPL